VGEDLIRAGNFGSEKIQRRSDDIVELWKNLKDLADYRRKRLQESLDFFQVSCLLLQYIRVDPSRRLDGK